MGTGRYAPFSLVFVSPADSWLVTHDGAATRYFSIAPGWHAITHRDLDERDEPRTARVLDALEDYRPASVDAAIARTREILAWHGEGGAPVCLHQGRMITVSSSIVWLARGAARYLHGEDRPCESRFTELTDRLTDSEEAG